ncbi:hypothetical protein [Actinomadura litoris]|uniref:Uncharacterized protein n=1 Tax=Actinomadura litoris TaxID=2678616 RepID=A0A7K1KSY8_9ACTN|nr:hypothetical protein [Actinomadura litoris]MUN35304.1 hypothetical protein [Actinomadura litoris]
MYLQLVVWDLAESDVSIDDLRAYLRDYAVEAYSQLPGMRFKVWFANPERRVWGAVYLWDTVEHMSGPAQVSRAIELIGYPPTSVSVFEVEAAAEGHSVHTALASVGAAFA